MFKYILIFILNAPLVIIGMIRTVRSYNAGIITRLRASAALTAWIILLLGLIFAKPLYDFLERNHLTDSTPLSLFDVIQTTGIILALYMCTRLYAKNDALEHRLNQLNREISLRDLRKK